MLEVNVEKTLASLEKVKAEIKARLEGMVTSFVTDVAAKAVDLTPYGDESNPLYKIKPRLELLDDKSGHAKGGWAVEMNSMSGDIYPDRATDEGASSVKSGLGLAAEQYKLGDNVYISNLVPYMTKVGWTMPNFGSIEGGYSSQAPEGVAKPLLVYILAAYSSDIQQHYRSAK